MNQKVLLAVALFVVLSCGFLLGRQFPAHHYEMAMSTNPYFVLDTTTGRVCDDRGATSLTQASDPFAKFGGHAIPEGGDGVSGNSAKIPLSSLFGKEKTGGAASSASADAFFNKIRKQNLPNSNGLPYCGK